MPVKALYPGTFDPPTNGHIDLIKRGAKIFDHLTVAVLNNPVKDPLFTVEERAEMLREVTAEIGNVSVARFDGLMVEFARQQGASAVLRGIRAISDYEHEFQMALMNRRLAPEVETVFLQPPAATPSSARGWSRKSSVSAATSRAWSRRTCSSGCVPGSRTATAGELIAHQTRGTSR